MDYNLINMKIFGDERGKLISLEGSRNIPFDIKRVYWIFDTAPDQDRGMHAHKNMEQIIVAMDGACQFVLDDGKTREKVWLSMSMHSTAERSFMPIASREDLRRLH